jgi:hypothetical protein
VRERRYGNVMARSFFLDGSTKGGACTGGLF